MEDNSFDSTRICYLAPVHQYICHKTLSGENMTAKILTQHSETNNSDIANKSRDAFFKEVVKQRDVSVVNYTSFYSNYFSFLTKSHTFCHSYQ
jgi:hypothetical protein